MPIYEYACESCGATVEIIRSLSAPDPESHEGCGGRLRRLLSAPTTRVGETGGPGSGATDSMRRFQENRRIAAETPRKR